MKQYRLFGLALTSVEKDVASKLHYKYFTAEFAEKASKVTFT